MEYDYIIAGAGCAGLSLAVHLIDSGLHRGKKILLLDRESKDQNDRTWCFWEEQPGLFESIVYRKWNRLRILADGFEKTEEVAPYTYKMIRGIDFYRYCKARIEEAGCFDWKQEGIRSVVNREGRGMVETTQGAYFAAYVFCSISLQEPRLRRGEEYLLQHFKGRVLRAQGDVFDPHVATLMDFRVPQAGDTAFVYVMPFSATTALVEYTVFGPKVLEEHIYSEALDQYIQTQFPGTRFQTEEEEFGVIPMTGFEFPLQDGRIFFMGTAAGNTKPSTGYTFQFIQQHCTRICKALSRGEPLEIESVLQPRFVFYDRILLHILGKRLLPGKDIFVRLFQKNKIAEVLRFLENKTAWMQDIRIISHLQKGVFLRAALHQIALRLFR